MIAKHETSISCEFCSNVFEDYLCKGRETVGKLHGWLFNPQSHNESQPAWQVICLMTKKMKFSYQHPFRISVFRYRWIQIELYYQLLRIRQSFLIKYFIYLVLLFVLVVKSDKVRVTHVRNSGTMILTSRFAREFFVLG